MRLDELTRELMAQADAAMADSPVAMDALRARRSRVRRRRAVSGAAAAVLVAGLGVAWWGGTTPAVDSIGPAPSSTGTPSPTPSPTTETPEVVAGWTAAFDCPAQPPASCELPDTLTYRGRTYTELGGHSGTQPVHAGNGVNRELGLSVVPTGEPILVLAGATGTGPGSKLLASVNWAESSPLPGTGLSVRLLRVTPDSQKVVVQELGRPGSDEVLRIATYHPVG